MPHCSENELNERLFSVDFNSNQSIDCIWIGNKDKSYTLPDLYIYIAYQFEVLFWYLKKAIH